MSQPNFWQDEDNSHKVIRQLKALRSTVEPWQEAMKKLQDLQEMVQISSDNDEALLKEIESELAVVSQEINQLEFNTLLGGELDRNNAILSINAGAGGTESCDWAKMLLRMYLRFAEQNGFSTQILDILEGEEAGIKNVTLSVQGPYAYGYLKAERGVHRLVRISPFDANKRRHTSFASVDVIPELEDDDEVQIDEKDLKIEVFRSKGAGGQSVNTTDSAVRITHIPTNIVAQCQNERSQYQNKQTALKILKARIYAYEREKKEEQLRQHSGEKKKIEWGSQIRSYILHPYNLVKDHRSEFETGDTDKVLDGGIKDFIEAYLKARLA